MRASLVRALAAASAGDDVLWVGPDVGIALREISMSLVIWRLNTASRHVSVQGGGTIRFDRAEDPAWFAGLEVQAVEYDTPPPDDVLAAITSRIRPKRQLRTRVESVFVGAARWEMGEADPRPLDECVAEAFRRGWQAWGGPHAEGVTSIQHGVVP